MLAEEFDVHAQYEDYLENTNDTDKRLKVCQCQIIELKILFCTLTLNTTIKTLSKVQKLFNLHKAKNGVAAAQMTLDVLKKMPECTEISQKLEKNYPDLGKSFIDGDVDSDNDTYDSLSDVPESRVCFASKNLTPCRMH